MVYPQENVFFCIFFSNFLSFLNFLLRICRQNGRMKGIRPVVIEVRSAAGHVGVELT